VWEATPGMRARPVSAPTATMQTTATQALATPPGFLFAPNHGGRIADLDAPHPTVCASDDRRALVMANTTNNVPSSTSEPISTVVAGTQRHGLVVPLRRNGEARSTGEPVPTVTAAGNHHGLLMRNNGGGAEMVTPTDEPARTMTTKGHQSLLVPYNGNGHAKPADEPLGTQPATDRWSLVDPDQIVDDCGFRMLEPYEIAAAMAFPAGYIPRDLTKRDQVKLAGNAVTPPVMTWITGRLAQAIGARA
jgi:DNA (cytosine-5)-methyltransferase 1